jgi:hypothetical protein
MRLIESSQKHCHLRSSCSSNCVDFSSYTGPFVLTSGVGAMAFWTALASIASNDHEDGAAGRFQMRFHKNMDKEVWAHMLDTTAALWRTYVCDMCNHMHEIRHVLRGNYLNNHFKPPMIHRLYLALSALKSSSSNFSLNIK